MNKFLPPKPEFQNEGLIDFIIRPAFEAWYDRDIVPIFEGATQVWIRHKNLYDGSIRDVHLAAPIDATATALLIGITPIKLDTAEDLLRELVSDYCARLNHRPALHPTDPSALSRAKAFLEKK